MGQVTTKQLEAVFADADWPMLKDAVVAHAEARSTDDEVVAAVRSIPVDEYGRFEDVLSAIPTIA